MSDMTQTEKIGIWKSIGPALITASVVIGPGSILSASKIGHQFGYQMTWVLVLAILLMIGMTALSARLGVTLENTLCEELAQRAGRPLAALAGVTLFLIAACFQFGNNLGVLAAIEPFYGSDGALPYVVIIGINGLIVFALFGFKALYEPIERFTKLLVGLMLVGFAGNLLLARPDLLQMFAGLVPQFPEGAAETLLPKWQPAVVEGGEIVKEGAVVDNLVPVTALFATTFSVGAAFYQSYLVRQKGWTEKNLNQGFLDSVIGIGVLASITLMIMMTAASVLHNNPNVGQLKSAADVAVQLEPLFGTSAKLLFCMGIFAGAFSSFFVNAMIGGSILADGFGKGGYIDQPAPKAFTVLALATGMLVALYVKWTGQRPVGLIIFAQALTVLGVPILAAIILGLAVFPKAGAKDIVPAWMKIVASIGLIISIFLAARTAVRLILPLIN